VDQAHPDAVVVMAGYSGKPLAEKLGIEPGLKVYVDQGPSDLDLGGAPHTNRLPKQADIILVFCTDRSRLEARLSTLVERTVVNGMIWVCWPKKASGVTTDLTENFVRDFGMASGMVDVKVAAIDETWSALKLASARAASSAASTAATSFVRRLKDR
jgi:hypothetical protein